MPVLLDPLIRANRNEIIRIARRHGASNVRVFGSRSRGVGRADSDLDVLITFEEERSLLDLVAIKLDLQDLLGCSVDVVTEPGLSQYIKDQVLRDAIPL